MSKIRLQTAFITLAFALVASPGIAAERVKLSTGEIVILSDDGTWNYEKNPVKRKTVIRTRRSNLDRYRDCYSPYGQYLGGYNIWIDPVKWKQGGNQPVQPPALAAD